MSIYFVKGKGWRYDFIQKGERHTAAWYRTKGEAKTAEAERKEAIRNPQPVMVAPTDMAFLDLVNRVLDHMKAYRSKRHYQDYVYMAKRWVKKWDMLNCSEISADMVQAFVIQRSRRSRQSANKDIRYLKAVFNFGLNRRWISANPVVGIGFFPVEKVRKYVPSKEDVLKVISAANEDTRDYLWTISDTLGRVGEINQLRWDDVDFGRQTVTLYTRKKKDGSLTPREIPMTRRLQQILLKRFERRDKETPWVFWHTYPDRETNALLKGPYKDRKKIMRTLCKKAQVKYFRYHALRHFGASLMERTNVNIGSIQRLLGHESRETTEIYLHSIGEAERNAVRIYEDATDDSHTISHTNVQAEIAGG